MGKLAQAGEFAGYAQTLAEIAMMEARKKHGLNSYEENMASALAKLSSAVYWIADNMESGDRM